ncbi:hypothetical protein AOA80_07330 [Methanomassiliicoccales archaeon RumEn M1]|nr:hypothetical protein AOA80_07330 [Methanomassiliicoccales archaeon RumEn M1]
MSSSLSTVRRLRNSEVNADSIRRTFSEGGISFHRRPNSWVASASIICTSAPMPRAASTAASISAPASPP